MTTMQVKETPVTTNGNKEVTPAQWEAAQNRWIEAAKDSRYLNVTRWS